MGWTTKTRLLVGYIVGAILILLGLPLFFGYVMAIVPLVIGVALIVRTRRVERRWL